MYPVVNFGGGYSSPKKKPMQEMLTYIIGPGAAAFLGWFFGRRKLNADADATELDNVEKGLGIYRKIIEDLIKGQEELKLKVGNIQDENKALAQTLAQHQVENQQFLRENKGLRTENENLRKRITILEKEINKLKNETHE